MELWHGSEQIIQKPQYGVGTVHNDFGRGFYTTRNKALAKEWACAKGNTGYINHYLLDTTGLKILDLQKPPYHILNWIGTLLKYRNPDDLGNNARGLRQYILLHFSVPEVENADIVIGYRADDSYFSYVKFFLTNRLSVENLEQVMKFGEFGKQIVLKSQRAFQQITFLDFEEVPVEEFHPKYLRRDHKAREQVMRFINARINKRDTFAIDLWRNGDDVHALRKSLSRILSRGNDGKSR